MKNVLPFIAFSLRLYQPLPQNNLKIFFLVGASGMLMEKSKGCGYQILFERTTVILITSGFRDSICHSSWSPPLNFICLTDELGIVILKELVSFLTEMSFVLSSFGLGIPDVQEQA